MKEYFVSAMTPISMTVQANSFEEAVDEYMNNFDFDDLRIGDVDPTCGFAVTDLETGEQQVF